MICLLCQEEFKPRQNNQKYCCLSCGKTHREMKLNIKNNRGYLPRLIDTLVSNEKVDKWTKFDSTGWFENLLYYKYLKFLVNTPYARLNDRFYEQFGDVL